MSLDKDKLCSKCKQVKPASEFRIRTEKRQRRLGKKTEPFRYLNNTCRKCDLELTKANYRKDLQLSRRRGIESKKRRTERIGRQELNRRVREYKARNKEKIRKRRSEYYKTHPKVYEDHKAIQKRAREELHDWYIIQVLRRNTTLTAKEIRSMPELIEAERQRLILSRLIRKSDKPL